jgi:hypothetical protein
MDDKTRQLVLDYQLLFGSDRGKRVLDDLKSRHNGRIMPTGVPDVMAFEVGKRETYLYITDKIEADPDAVVQEVAEIE